MALLVPASRRALRVGLVGALSAHYGSPGRLADYRRQFERTVRASGEEPSIFATALETLAIKAFRDMGQTACLHIVRDRFVAGHDSCELCRHLDSVLPETPIWDIVDRCRVWESHADSDVRRISKPDWTGPFRRTWWLILEATWMTAGWQQSRLHGPRRISLRLCSTAAYWPSRAGPTPEAGAPYCGTVVASGG